MLKRDGIIERLLNTWINRIKDGSEEPGKKIS